MCSTFRIIDPSTGHRGTSGWSLARLLVITLAFLPLLSIPLHVLGTAVANTSDQDSSDGVFPLGQILGVVGPAAVVVAIASRRVRFAAAVALGLAAGAVSVVVLLVALVAYCGPNDC